MAMPDRSREDPAWPYFKRARNRLRKIEPISFVLLVGQRLFEVHANPRQLMTTYQPWNLLTAMRWALMDSDPLAHRRPPAKQNDLAVVLNVIHDLEGAVTLKGAGALILLLRRMSFQQFWLQGRDVHGSDVARVELLFGQLPVTHPLQRQFQAVADMTITEFSDLALAMLTVMAAKNPPRFVTAQSFDLIAPSLRPGLLDSFLRFLSKMPEELPDWIAGLESSNRSISAQLLLSTPFLLAPLLQLPQGYMVYHPTLLLRSLYTLVYQTLKRPDPGAFGIRFGPIFEAYVNRCLTSAGVPFENEAELKRRLPMDKKCVDFLVSEPDGTLVMIEAKSAEMPAAGRVAHDADIVLGAIKHSALKAVTQALSALPGLRMASPVVEAETFLIVITYDDLHLGCSHHFREVYGDEFIPKLEGQFGIPLPIPVEHLFFMSVQDFEYLLSCVHDGKTTLANALRHARKEDADPATRKFEFSQHFDTLCKVAPHLPTTTEGLDRVWQRISSRLPESERASLEKVEREASGDDG